MKLLFTYFILLLSYSTIYTQIYSSTSSFTDLTNYPNRSQQDPIFIFCDSTNIRLSINAPNTSEHVFYWYKYSHILQSFVLIKTEVSSLNSTLSNITAGGYKVIIKNDQGMFLGCYRAWALVPLIDVDASIQLYECNSIVLQGEYNINKNLEYYEFPEDPFIIDSSTVVKVCFDIEHTNVSDLGFMLWTPNGVGVTINPHPHPQLIPAQNLNCNSGDNINNLCFSTNISNPFQVCNLPTPITGNYGWYSGGINPPKYPVFSNNKYLLNGANAYDTGWEIQFFDAKVGDIGFVKNIELTFINPNNNSCSNNVITLSSGPIQFMIDDAKDNWSNAIKYTMPSYSFITDPNPISLNYMNTAHNYITSNQNQSWLSSDIMQNFTNSKDFTTHYNNPSSILVQDYIFSIEDQYGCIFSDTIKYIHQSINIDSVSLVHNTCTNDNQGIITIHSEFALEYSIDSGKTWQSSNIFNSLHSRKYYVFVKNNLGCLDALDVEIKSNVILNPELNIIHNSCHGECNASISINTTGGVSPYSYIWGHTSTSSSTLFDLCSGVYMLTISDETGCDSILQIDIINPNPISFSANINSSLCVANTGAIELQNLAGGTPPFSYLWNNGEITPSINQLQYGVYQLTISDNNYCDTVIQFTVTPISNPELQIISSKNQNLCFGESMMLEANIMNAQLPYEVFWDNGTVSNTISVNPTSNTCYHAYVKDGNECISDIQYKCIEVHPPIEAGANMNLILCENQQTKLKAIATGGHPDSTLTYIWSDNLGTGSSVDYNILGKFPDTHQCYVVISDGCSTNDSIYFTISYYEPPNIRFTSDKQKGCTPFEVNFTNETNIYSNCYWKLNNGNVIQGCSNINYVFNDSGEFNVALYIHYGNDCYDSLIKNNYISVSPTPKVNFTLNPDSPSIYNTNTLASDSSGEGLISWEWTLYSNLNILDTIKTGTGKIFPIDFSDYFNSNSAHERYFEEQFSYPISLSVKSPNGCKNSLTRYIHFDKTSTIFLPNSFTPNDDDINEYFYPITSGIHPTEDYEFTIYDRWGKLVFTSNNIHNGWDGKNMYENDIISNGVYSWMLKCKNLKNQFFQEYGKVLLLKK